MTSPFGYAAMGNYAALLPHAERLKPRAMGFMDNLGGAVDFKRRHPNCTVIHRAYSDKNGTFGKEEEFHFTPGRTLAYLQDQARSVPGDIFINLACEPSIGEKPRDIQRMVDEQLKAFEWAQPRGVRVAGPHAAGYAFDDVHHPILAPLMDFIGRYPSQFVYTTDEYAAGHMWSGVVDPRFPGGNERGHIPPSSWVRPLGNSLTEPRFWHAGRVTHLVRYLRANGLHVPRIIITESGLDALNDAAAEAFRKSLKLTPPYDNQRGWKSLRTQLAEWYGNAEQGFADMLIALYREVYAFYGIEAVLIYGWGYASPEWEQFDMSNALTFQRALEGYQLGSSDPVTQPTIPAVPKPANAGVYGAARKLRTSSYIRVRNAPTVNAAEVARPANGAPLEVFYETKRQADNYTWYWVEGLDFEGWQAVVYEFEWEQYITPKTPKTFRNPASYPHVILEGGKFNAPRDYSFNPTARQQHEGLDFSSLNTAPRPRIVVAPAGGYVEKVKSDQYYGNYVRLYHADGWRAYYAHLEKPLVAEGQTVREGDPIGWEGVTGNVSGPHLHWTVVHIGYGLRGYVVDEVVDPLPLLRTATPQPDPIDYKALSEAQAIEIAHLKAVMAHQAQNVRLAMQQLRAEVANLEQSAVALESATEQI